MWLFKCSHQSEQHQHTKSRRHELSTRVIFMRFVASGSWLLSGAVDTCLLPLPSTTHIRNHLAICGHSSRFSIGSPYEHWHWLCHPHCHCVVCLISQFISCQTACQWLCFWFGFSQNSVSLSSLKLSSNSNSNSNFKWTKPTRTKKDTAVKTFEFDVLTVCLWFALVLVLCSCLAYGKCRQESSENCAQDELFVGHNCDTSLN